MIEIIRDATGWPTKMIEYFNYHHIAPNGMTQTIKIDSETVEVDGEVYRKVEKGPWPFRPLPLHNYPALSCDTGWHGTSGVTPDYELFPDDTNAKEMYQHVRRVLKSMRLYENAKAEGKLGECWYVLANMVWNVGGQRIQNDDYFLAAAQAGRLFATKQEAEEYAKTL